MPPLNVGWVVKKHRISSLPPQLRTVCPPFNGSMVFKGHSILMGGSNIWTAWDSIGYALVSLLVMFQRILDSLGQHQMNIFVIIC